MSLRVEELSVELAGKSIIHRVSIEVNDGEIVAVLGPSGSGKTTMLRAIAGLVPLAQGRIWSNGHDISNQPSFRRGVGYMFQEHALFPHRNVAENIEFGLRMAKMRKPERLGRRREVLELVGLGGFDQRPVASLSGGERQRVALARAIAPKPALLLLDEPFSSLDRALRERLWEDLVDVLVQTNTGCIHVTHDHVEALRSGDRLVVLSEGEILQAGSPLELWRMPNSEAIGRIVGPLNTVPVELLSSEAMVTPWGRTSYQHLLARPAPNTNSAKLLARPDAFEISIPTTSGQGWFGGTVIRRNFMGTHALLEVALDTNARAPDEPNGLLVLETTPSFSELGSRISLKLKDRSVVITAT